MKRKCANCHYWGQFTTDMGQCRLEDEFGAFELISYDATCPDWRRVPYVPYQACRKDCDPATLDMSNLLDL